MQVGNNSKLGQEVVFPLSMARSLGHCLLCALYHQHFGCYFMSHCNEAFVHI